MARLVLAPQSTGRASTLLVDFVVPSLSKFDLRINGTIMVWALMAGLAAVVFLT